MCAYFISEWHAYFQQLKDIRRAEGAARRIGTAGISPTRLDLIRGWFGNRETNCRSDAAATATQLRTPLPPERTHRAERKRARHTAHSRSTVQHDGRGHAISP